MSQTSFIHDDFLLQTDAARRLYHEYAAAMPIIDYHCHLPPADIAEDRHWENLARIWLGGDHYKWRAMRTNGVPEEFCTGNTPDRDKFARWAETVPYTLGNPLYHWSHLELARVFGIEDRLLSPETADYIWERCNEQIQDPGFSARSLMQRFSVAVVCTTDDPTDGLEAHRAIAADSEFAIPVLPTWRPDKAMAVEDPGAFNAWTDKLAEAADIEIRDLNAFREALKRRHAYFHEQGCRLSDHGIETVYAEAYSESGIRAAFDGIRAGQELDNTAVLQFKSAMLYELAVMDHETGWVQQLHLGALRNNNSKMFERLGPDTGFDSMADLEQAGPLGRFLDRLASEGTLAKTIVYNLNPRDNAPIVTMLGNFQDGTVPGKMQFGSGWWFLDQQEGMERQMQAVALLGVLRRFVGMTTDSRSFLSYPRHEYFRRVLCNLLGRDMAAGLLPDDLEHVGNMVAEISYRNAAQYFDFPNLPAS